MTAAVSGAAASAGATVERSRASLAQNFETFLSLLTAQLKNQDPLSPMDSNQFTSQLTEMTGVEQQLLTNELLTKLVNGDGSAVQDGVAYVGKTVTASWPTVKMQDGKASWNYELAGDATEVTLTVVNEFGRPVWSGPAPAKSGGEHAFTWDGKDSSGTQLTSGTYSLKVTAKGANDTTIGSQVLVRGVATGVELYDGEAYLTVGNAIVPLAQVIGVTTTPTQTAAQSAAQQAAQQIVEQTTGSAGGNLVDDAAETLARLFGRAS